MFPFGPEPFHRIFQHAAVGRKAYAGDVAMLGGAQKVAGAPDFQVPHGHLEAAAQFCEFPDRIEPLFRHFGKDLSLPVEEPGPGNLFRPPYPSPHLVNLGEPHAVGVVDEHGIGIGLVQAVFNEGGAEEHVVAAFVEVHHHLLQLTAFHATIGHADGDILRQYFPEVVQHGSHGFNTVIDEVGLAAPFLFPEDSVFHDEIIVLRHIGLDGMAVRRRGGDGDHVPYAGKAHVEGPGNRSGGQGEHIDAGGPGFPFFLLHYAEALFFIHHKKPQFLTLHLFIEHRMGTDDDIQFPVLQFPEDFPLFPDAGEPVQHRHIHTESFHAVLEILVVLLGKDRGGTEHHGLVAAHDAFENGPHGHFGLAESHVPAEEHVHGNGLFHGPFDGIDGGELVFGLHVGEGVFEFPLFRCVRSKGDSLCDFPLCINIEEPFCQFFNGFPGFRPDFLPVGFSHFA